MEECRRYDTAEPVRIEIAAGRIAAVTGCNAPAAETQRWPWVAPGLIDIQFNGYGGQEFSAPTSRRRKWPRSPRCSTASA